MIIEPGRAIVQLAPDPRSGGVLLSALESISHLRAARLTPDEAFDVAERLIATAVEDFSWYLDDCAALFLRHVGLTNFRVWAVRLPPAHRRPQPSKPFFLRALAWRLQRAGIQCRTRSRNFESPNIEPYEIECENGYTIRLVD